jgi:hypothetical protein
MQLADAQIQRPGIEHLKEGVAAPFFFRLPAELQKTVVEYVCLNFLE